MKLHYRARTIYLDWKICTMWMKAHVVRLLQSLASLQSCHKGQSSYSPFCQQVNTWISSITQGQLATFLARTIRFPTFTIYLAGAYYNIELVIAWPSGSARKSLHYIIRVPYLLKWGTTHNDPQRPTMTHNNPQRPTTTHKNPQWPTTTHKNPQKPTTTVIQTNNQFLETRNETRANIPPNEVL